MKRKGKRNEKGGIIQDVHKLMMKHEYERIKEEYFGGQEFFSMYFTHLKFTILHLSVYEGRTQLIKLILQHHSQTEQRKLLNNIDVNQNPPIFLAILQDDVEIIKLLSEYWKFPLEGKSSVQEAYDFSLSKESKKTAEYLRYTYPERIPQILPDILYLSPQYEENTAQMFEIHNTSPSVAMDKSTARFNGTIKIPNEDSASLEEENTSQEESIFPPSIQLAPSVDEDVSNIVCPEFVTKLENINEVHIIVYNERGLKGNKTINEKEFNLGNYSSLPSDNDDECDLTPTVRLSKVCSNQISPRHLLHNAPESLAAITLYKKGGDGE